MTDEEFLEYYKKFDAWHQKPQGVMIPTSLLDKMITTLQFYADDYNYDEYGAPYDSATVFDNDKGSKARKVLGIES